MNIQILFLDNLKTNLTRLTQSSHIQKEMTSEKLSNHLTLDIPKIPEVQAESLNTELPKISSNSRQTK